MLSESVKDANARFAEECDWRQFHDPKILAMALAAEVGEIIDHFRWLTSEESVCAVANKDVLPSVQIELADVMILALEFATVCEIDVAQAVETKLKVNEARYPVEKAKGSRQ